MCMCIVCNKVYYFEGAIECSVESFSETYEFESISYYLCFNFDSSKCTVISMCELTHTQPKDKNIKTLCLCVKLMRISQCLLVVDCTRTTAAKEMLLTLRICWFCQTKQLN